MPDGLSDDEITNFALNAGRGDRAAAHAFICATQRDVWRFLAYLTGPAEAEDLTQETFVRALSGVHRFAARSHARNWLLSIARRVAADHIGLTMNRPKIVGNDWQAAADRQPRGHLPGIDDAVAINLAVRELPEGRREAFVLTQVLGLGYAEAAEVCGCPVGTIRSRVARARHDLVAALGERRRPSPAASR